MRLANVAILLVVSVTVGLLLVEIMFRVAFRHSMDFDMEMWKYATQIKVPSADPREVHEHRPNGSAFLMGVKVTTESHGLRDHERTLEKPPGTFRIAALGDSITMGWGVPQNQTYPAQLEEMLNASAPNGCSKPLHYEVLNLGVGNYNTVQEVERLKLVGLGFHPDLITLGYFINDAEPTPRPADGFWIEHSYVYAFSKSRARLANGSNGNYEDYYRHLYQPDQAGWKEAEAALAELAEIGGAHHIPVVVFLIPELHSLSRENPFATVYRQVAAAATERGLTVIDLFPAFAGRVPEARLWVHPLDAHHNATAQAIMARAMLGAMEQRSTTAAAPLLCPQPVS